MPNKIYELDGFPGWIRKDWEKWYDIARSYERASRILLDAEIPERDYYSERDILPVLHTTRHYIELVMKCLLLRSGREINGKHDLMPLKAKLDKIHPDLFDKEAREFIKFLDGLDPQGMSLRYPVDLSGKEFFTDVQGRHMIDLGTVYTFCRRIFDQTDSFIMMIRQQSPGEGQPP